MKNVIFYAVMPQDRTSKAASKAYPFFPFTRAGIERAHDLGQDIECFALDVSDQDGRSWRYHPEGAGLVLDSDRTSVAYTSCSIEWLNKRCVKISEKLALKLHPEIVEYMAQ